MAMEQQPHQPQPTQPEHGTDVALSSIILTGIAGTAILVVLIILVRGLFVNALQQENYTKVLQQKPEELQQVREQAQNHLHTYAWIDQAQGIVSLPIEDALALAVAQLSADQHQPVKPAPAPTVQDTPVTPGTELAVTEPASPAPAPSATESTAQISQHSVN
jgi:hypothetical protein